MTRRQKLKVYRTPIGFHDAYGAAPKLSGRAERPKHQRSPPRLSRAKFEKAEQVLSQTQAEHENAIAAIRQREKDVQQERRDPERRHETERTRLEAAVDEARKRHGAALKKWRI